MGQPLTVTSLCRDSDVSSIGEFIESLSVYPGKDASVGVASTKLRVSVVDMLSCGTSSRDGPNARSSSGVSL